MNYKKFFTSLLLFLTITSGLLVVKAQYNDGAFAQSITDPLKKIEETTQLPTFETQTHDKASIEPGASNISSAIYFVLDFMKFVIGGVAVIMIIITGIQLIMARKKIDEVWNKQKEHLIMIVTGFVFIMVADVAVRQVFFGVEGEVFESQAQAQEAAESGTEQLRGIYNVVLMVAGAFAILMLIIAGIRLLTSGGNEEVQTKVKKQITWIVIGLFILGVAEFVVQDIVFPKQGAEIPSADKARSLIVDITNFVSAFVSIAAVISSIYGGILYITAVGNEEKTAKAKKVLLGAIIALIVAVGAFAIVNTVIQLEPGA
jgi:cytochrome bd-type quinol oxidase subunit 2